MKTHSSEGMPGGLTLLQKQGGGKEERWTGTHTEKEEETDDHPSDKKQTQDAGWAGQAQAQLILTKVPVLGNAECYLMSCHKATTEPRAW